MSGIGYTVHTGSSDAFATGWDRIFGAKKDKEKKPKKEESKTKQKKDKKK